MNGDWHRQKAFVAAFALGTLLIVGVRESFPGLGGALFAASACAAIVVGGAVLYYMRDSAAAVRAADDFYYVGLLFTLVSLIHVLVRIFVFGDSNNQNRTQQLIGNFGIALISTVVGIVARVVLLGSDPHARNRPARQQAMPRAPESPDPIDQPIADATQTLASRSDTHHDLVRLRDQVRQAVDALSHFTRVTLAQAHGTKAHSERLIREFNDRVDELANERLSALDNVASRWEHTTRTIQDQIANMAVNADGRLAQVVSQADEAWQRLAAHAEQASDIARQRTEAAGEQLAAMLESIRAVQQALLPLAAEMTAAGQSTAALTTTADTTSSSVAHIADGIRDAATEMHSVHQAATAELSTLHEAVTSLNAAISPLAEFTKMTTQGMSTLGQAASDAEASARQIRITLEQAEDRLASAVDAVATASNTFESSLGSLNGLQEQVARLGESATAAAVGLDARAGEIIAAHNTLAEGAKKHHDAAIAAYERAAAGLADLAGHHEDLLRRQGDSWSKAIDALNDSIRQQQVLAEQNVTNARQLLTQVAKEQEPDHAPRWFGIGPRRP